MAGKAESFSWKQVEYELAVKYFENLWLFLNLMMLNWVKLFKQERALWQTFTYPKSTKETLKVWIIFTVNNKNARTLVTLDIHHSIF